MYAKDTILELKEQREPEIIPGPPERDPDTKEIVRDEAGEPVLTQQVVPFAYNRVRVIGPSPINHGGTSGEWSGASGAGVIITPAGEDFASTIDEPLGKLQALYNVVEVPEEYITQEIRIKVVNANSDAAGETPEAVFAREAPGKANEDGSRVRTPIGQSPLEDPREEVSGSPLDVPKKRTTTRKAKA